MLESETQTTCPLACNLGAFDAAQQERYRIVRDALRAAVQEIRELENGYALVLPTDPMTCLQAMEFATLERCCCPFWTFHLELHPEPGPLLLSLTGPAGAKEILRDALVI